MIHEQYHSQLFSFSISFKYSKLVKIFKIIYIINLTSISIVPRVRLLTQGNASLDSSLSIVEILYKCNWLYVFDGNNIFCSLEPANPTFYTKINKK